MMFFDFDRTVFDTDRFIEHIIGKKIVPMGWKKSELSTNLNLMAMDGIINFPVGELSQFVYTDFCELRARENSVFLITSRNESLQRLKIASALGSDWLKRTIFVESGAKAQKLLSLSMNFRISCFVDDRPEEVISAASLLPHVSSYLILRNADLASTVNCSDFRTVSDLKSFLD